MRRSVVDYALARRATLASVLSGHTTLTDVCDAHPYLLRAAKFHGEPTEIKCPICRKVKLTHVTYVYGDELGRYEGRVKQGRELDEMAMEYAEFQVYVVEVCQSCGWNHLASSYVLGTGEPTARRGRRARAGD
jgi:ribosomal protein L32